MGLVLKAVPDEGLDAEIEALADWIQSGGHLSAVAGLERIA